MDLEEKGYTWVLATGYVKVWERLYRAEENMIGFAPQEKVIQSALYDESRLEDSDIKNRDDLLAKLRKAIGSIDPSAYKYLKSTVAVTQLTALAIGTTALPGGAVAADYCAPLLATGGVPPYKWTVIGGSIPEGLVLGTTGVLRGTPTSDGHGNFTVQATDSAGVAVEKYFDLLISPPKQPATPLAFSTTAPLPQGSVGVEYKERLFATGGTPPYSWVITSGTKPDGLDMSTSGVLSGKPTADNTYEFAAKVTDSADTSVPPRQFTLTIMPSGASAAVSVCGTQAEVNARGVLSEVRHSLNEYRNSRWKGLILARNRLLATFLLTAMIVFALLAIAIMSGADSSSVIAATVFYLVGATAGLCGRLGNASQAESAIADYGLSAARLITIPLFSGLGAIGGLLFVAYLPFASPLFGPEPVEKSIHRQLPDAAEKAAQKAQAPPTGNIEKAAPTAKAPTTGAAEKAAPKAQAPKAGAAEKAAPKAQVPTTGAAQKAAPKAQAQKASAAEKGDSNGSTSGGNKTPQKKEEPSKLEAIFDLKKNMVGLFVAAVFGLAPGMLFVRLQQQADRYKADLKSSQSTEGAQKT
jgi:hypothetical protein